MSGSKANPLDTQTNPAVSCGSIHGPVSFGQKAASVATSLIQNFGPITNICAHLDAFHIYASDPTRRIEAHHYCAHVSHDVRQCLLYDSDAPNARLIGVEYMITPELYETLAPEERRLWHSHAFEVKSGQLCLGLPLTHRSDPPC